MSEYLSEDLILEILSRLPSKSLLRFRTLSKSLRSCIDSPHFIRYHTLHSPKKVLVMHEFRAEESCIQHFYTSHSEDQLPLCSRNGYVGITPVQYCYTYDCIVGSCNGIVCLVSSLLGMALWNPSVRRILELPRSPPSKCFNRDFVFMGFGFDPITGDYKVVMTSYKHKIGLPHTYIYTIKTGIWCEIASPTTPISYVNSLGCFVHGALHWVARHVTDESVHQYIMTFDLSTHVFGTIELPEPTWKISRIGRQLTVINGCLAIISLEDDSSLIWVRREHNNIPPSWHLEFKLANHEFEGKEEVSQLTTNGHLLVGTFHRGLHAYDPETRVPSRLAEFNVSCSKFDMVECAESLELLDIGTPFGTPFKGNQTSVLGSNKKSRTSQPKIRHFQTVLSTRLTKMYATLGDLSGGRYYNKDCVAEVTLEELLMLFMQNYMSPLQMQISTI